VRALYWLLSSIAFVVLAPFLRLHAKTRGGWRQRLGLYREPPLGTGHPRLWLHGASAGDLLALQPMVARLRVRFPSARIVISTMTNSGWAMATERQRLGADEVVYVPWDTPFATARAIRAIRPDLLVLEYTEVWPNLIRAAKRSGAAVVLTNGRFSNARVRWYRRFLRAIDNPLKEIDLFLMREPDEAERALFLGAARNAVVVTGNTKFDALRSAEQPVDSTLAADLGISTGDRIFIAGSTHDGEEPELLRVFVQLKKTAPDLRLIIAPRYVDRAQKIFSLANGLGLDVVMRSRGARSVWQVLVLDSIGELTRVYQLASFVFVGGSLPCTQRGGQNILEPASHGKPVFFGPNMRNFHDSVQVLVGRGGIQVNDADHLLRVLTELMGRPEAMEHLGAMAKQAVAQISGASERNVNEMSKLLKGF
jgi:3-deoxy-D-manno-octulosonic-acid transferase